MNSQPENSIRMSENIVVADADYLDSVVFDLIVNFERMIGRPLPKADLSQWAVCMALDGGVRAGKMMFKWYLFMMKSIKKWIISSRQTMNMTSMHVLF